MFSYSNLTCQPRIRALHHLNCHSQSLDATWKGMSTLIACLTLEHTIRVCQKPTGNVCSRPSLIESSLMLTRADWCLCVRENFHNFNTSVGSLMKDLCPQFMMEQIKSYSQRESHKALMFRIFKILKQISMVSLWDLLGIAKTENRFTLLNLSFPWQLATTGM